MKSLALACAIAVGLGLPMAASSTPAATQHAAHAHAQTAAATTVPAAPQLHAALRGLWHGHVVNTRAYAMAVKKGDAAAAAKAAEATVANAQEIANAVAGFYGDDAGKGMMKLLGGHWAGVKALTDASHAGNQAGIDKAMQDLTVNAGEIAKFLHGANPDNWPEATVDGLLLAHAAHHKAQVAEIMAGNMTAEAKTWKAMQDHMNTIADALAGGIAAQFPNKVK
ncbi:MAG: hypothetical protein JSS23_10030 [Proteobacteria bacterium]|nr:hypothetical protein [Pseudomonadota bacterium]